ncbi:hypothetical protein FRC05_010262 [Tulasnella sp. 425]|nr:hypothetical protein FRC05_010262 [Tulasnella sp. 425]
MATDSPASAPGLVIHIVQFKYKWETSDENRGLVARRFQELAHTCLSETTGKPYIASLVAGSNVTREKDHDKCYDEFAHEVEMFPGLFHKNIVQFIEFVEDLKHDRAWMALTWEPNGNVLEFLPLVEWEEKFLRFAEARSLRKSSASAV